MFLKDLQTGQTLRVSRDSAGTQANGASSSPALSGEGRLVAFQSDASNLDAWDTKGYPDIFVWISTFVNDAPTALTLSSQSVAEGQLAGTVVGTFSSIDPDVGDTFTYSLLPDTGDTDNASFTIAGNQLKTAASLSFETKASYSIRVRTTDQSGLFFNWLFTIIVTNVNERPTALKLSATAVAENRPVGSFVGTFSTTDPDAGNTFTYALVPGVGGTDNASFTISGNQLRTAAAFNYESKKTYSIRVRTTDQGGLFFNWVFTITVTNVNEPSAALSLSNVTAKSANQEGALAEVLGTDKRRGSLAELDAAFAGWDLSSMAGSPPLSSL